MTNTMTDASALPRKTMAVIGGGPAGLAAAELLSERFEGVTVYEAMPTIGRKFLLAGKSGLNLTHGEDYSAFVTRYGEASGALRAALDAFRPDDVREWAAGLGIETFIGTSGRVFPKAMKASPLLRAWRDRLEARGVTIRTRWRWKSASGDTHLFETPEGEARIRCDATLLAMGGASWPRLGSDAAWVPSLLQEGIAIAPFQPANCGFDRHWSASFRDRFAGAPVKSVVATSAAGAIPGEFVISRHGVEGSLIYAHAAVLRDALHVANPAQLTLDLVPGRSREAVERSLAGLSSKTSFSNRLRKTARLDGVKAALVREIVPQADRLDPGGLSGLLKALPLAVQSARPIEEAISSAGGIRFDALDDRFMIMQKPGFFVAGEMMDWEAPTGGYLLTACMATGRAAARGLAHWLQDNDAC